MKKLINIFVIPLIFLNMICTSNSAATINDKFGAKSKVKKNHLASSIFSKILPYTKQSGNIIKEGIKDISLACPIIIGALILHEYGHGIAAKLLYGAPIDIELFAYPSTIKQKPIFQIGGIKIIGSYLGGFAMIGKSPENYSPLKKDISSFIIYLMGPVFGISSCLGAYILLKKRKNLYVSKAITLLLVLSQTVGTTGLRGIWKNDPRSDGANAINSLKNILKRM